MFVFLLKNSIWKKKLSFWFEKGKNPFVIYQESVFSVCAATNAPYYWWEKLQWPFWHEFLYWNGNPTDFLVNFLPKINITLSIQEPINWAFDSFWNPFFHFLVLIKILPLATNNFSFFHCCTSFFHNCFWK